MTQTVDASCQQFARQKGHREFNFWSKKTHNRVARTGRYCIEDIVFTITARTNTVLVTPSSICGPPGTRLRQSE